MRNLFVKSLFLALTLLSTTVVSIGQTTEGEAERQPVGTELGEMFQLASSHIQKPKLQLQRKSRKFTEAVESGEAREMSVNAYAYCLRGRTASGRYTEHGIIAVDPRVIPLGSRVHVPGYGWAIAADTGGAIKGRKIDLWMPTSGHCYRWGVRKVRIKVYPRV
jgi:3D (Asp-Asp-Asp) domain-containing protein